MNEDDNDVNALGDDDMHADDSKDDPTWNPCKESLLSEENAEDTEEASVEAEMADFTFESFERTYNKIKSEQNKRMKSEFERQPATVPIVNRRLFKIRLNDLLFTEHYRQG